MYGATWFGSPLLTARLLDLLAFWEVSKSKSTVLVTLWDQAWVTFRSSVKPLHEGWDVLTAGKPNWACPNWTSSHKTWSLKGVTCHSLCKLSCKDSTHGASLWRRALGLCSPVWSPLACTDSLGFQTEAFSGHAWRGQGLIWQLSICKLGNLPEATWQPQEGNLKRRQAARQEWLVWGQNTAIGTDPRPPVQ